VRHHTYMGDMTHCSDVFMCNLFSRYSLMFYITHAQAFGITPPHLCDWLIHVCDLTHLCVWQDSFMCVTWLIRICRDSFTCNLIYSKMHMKPPTPTCARKHHSTVYLEGHFIAQTHTHARTHTHTHTYIFHRQTDRQTDRQMERWTYMQTDGRSDRLTDRQADR